MLNQAKAEDIVLDMQSGSARSLVQRVRKSKLGYRTSNPTGTKAYHEDKKPADVFSLMRRSLNILTEDSEPTHRSWQPTHAHVYKQRANELAAPEFKQERGCTARLQYKISTMVQKDNSFILLFWIFFLFVVLVTACGAVFYLIGVSSFKDNGTLFPSEIDESNVFDYFFAGLLVMMDTGAMIQAQSILGKCCSFLFGLLGFGKPGEARVL
jgi:hypothetical protein